MLCCFSWQLVWQANIDVIKYFIRHSFKVVNEVDVESWPTVPQRQVCDFAWACVLKKRCQTKPHLISFCSTYVSHMIILKRVLWFSAYTWREGGVVSEEVNNNPDK